MTEQIDKINVLTVSALTKKYGDNIAVDGIGFHIDEGDFVALLGPNGAGKTTTIKMLTGLTKANAGEVRYYGSDFFKNMKSAKSFIGMVPQQSNLDRDLTAYENLYLHTILHGVPKAARREKIEAALGFAGLTKFKDREVKTFSGGMQRRLVIVRALLHDPKILFLDEPTVGLDPQIRHELWELIIKINQQKKTSILMTTHYIEEAEKLCDRVMIINAGRIVAEDKPDKLKKDVGNYVLEIFRDDRIEKAFFNSRQDAVSSIGKQSGNCHVREVSLEDVFLKITGNNYGEKNIGGGFDA